MGRRSRKKKSDIEARGVDENEVDDSEEVSVAFTNFAYFI